MNKIDDTISRQAVIDALHTCFSDGFDGDKWWNSTHVLAAIEGLPPAQPEQLEQCPIYGGMCAYPSDQCYDCPRHAGAKMEVTE